MRNLILAAALLASQVPTNQKVDQNLMANGQFLAPLGESLTVSARPVAIRVSPDEQWVYVKENRGLTVVDAQTWKVKQELASPGGASMTGLMLDKDGKRLWFSNGASVVHEAQIDADGTVKWGRNLVLTKPKIGGDAYPCGMALDEDKNLLYVAASRNNEIQVFDLGTGQVAQTLVTDIAPFDCALSGDTLFVSCWGGKRPGRDAKTADSSGTPVEVDERGIAKSGSLAIHDLAAKTYASVQTGLQPSQVVVGDDGRAYVANANGDTVTVLSADRKQTKELVVKPDFKLPFGSQTNALALAGDNLYVACGGNNAVAVIGAADLKVKGFVPTGWWPAGVAVSGQNLFVANAKGTGSRRSSGADQGFSVYSFTGTVEKIGLQELQSLDKHTQTVKKLNATQEIIDANTSVKSSAKPVPVPKRLGDPSLIKHVVYVIKENRTFDQLFGDIPKGDGDPKLCTFGRKVTPNHHALAEQFVLLDNYYCNGVNSADGHAWSVEGNASSYLERSFGGFTRSYPFGDDPLTPTSSGFLWDNVLRYGRSFRNYGEFDYAEVTPRGSWLDVYKDWRDKTGKFALTHKINVERVARYSNPEFPGWNMGIPDVLRAEIFIKELKQFEKKGTYPNLTILYLPNDHTSGTSPGVPTPRAQVADNDLALGRCIEAFSKTKFWKDTAFFVVEDDPQNGFDHVDGHRSICLVVSPYTRSGKVVSQFCNQTSVLHTMQRILGVPPLNQMDARSPLMTACFQAKPDFRPYKALSNEVPLDELNPRASALNAEGKKWAAVSAKIPLDKPDQMDLRLADQFNQAIWYSVKGTAKYPRAFAGAHGKGLKKKGLKSVGEVEDDND